MNEKQYQERVKRLQEVNAVVAKLDMAIRGDAFTLLKPYVTGSRDLGAEGETADLENSGGDSGPSSVMDLDAMLDKYASDKPVDNALLVAAIFYATYGKGPYPPKDFSDFGEKHNLVMPKQFHKSPGPKKVDGQPLFRNTGEGWQITVQGAKWFEAEYGVKQGKQAKPGSESS